MNKPELKVSVVVPTYRRPRQLARCLRALMVQDVDPASYEIIVADDGPDPATAHAVGLLRARNPQGPALHYLSVEHTQGPAGARNCGWRQARGEVIAFTDDDAIPSRHWLREGLAVLKPGVAAVAGSVQVPLPEAPTDYQLDAARLADAEFVTASCFVRRTELVAVGGFDERFTAAWREDSDLHFSLIEVHGGSHCLRRAPKAMVVHPIGAVRWGACLAQQRKIRFDALLYKKHPVLYRRRIRDVPRWDYYLIVATLLLALAAALAGESRLAGYALLAWLSLTLAFSAHRLQGTSRRPGHVAETVLTSAAIPPLAVFWRLVGAVRYRVLFV